MLLSRWLLIVLSGLVTIAFLVGSISSAAPSLPEQQPIIADDQPLEPPQDELSPQQAQAMSADIQRNLAMLQRTGRLAAAPAAQPVTLGWPLRMAPGLPDEAGFRISAFADHNPNSGHVLDYNGGTRTYDGHRGTDIALYPFNWNKVNAAEVQVIAAAAGTIVAKANVDPTDHNCITSSSDPWNYLALLHADGRLTIYGHMRYNSLTSKIIGQTVAQGEFLGIVGSSGNSSGPHVHFEVRFGSFSTAEWTDPYAGPASQPNSLWSNQRPYLDSEVDRLATHAAPPSTPDPCQPTITNLQDSFTLPRTIYFYTYYRDYQGALPTQRTLYRPDGSVFQASHYTSTTAFSSAWSNGWAVQFSANEPAGTWRFAATYNGHVSQTFFKLLLPATFTQRMYLPIIQR